MTITGLLKSHVKRGTDRFYSIVLVLAADETKRGHAVVPQQLEKLLDKGIRQRIRVRESFFFMAQCLFPRYVVISRASWRGSTLDHVREFV